VCFLPEFASQGGALIRSLLEHWKRNLLAIGAAQLLTMIGFSAYLPLVPFYMQELGATTTEQTTALMAIFNTGGAVAMAIAAPIWGTLADRHGRKLMLVRATAAGAVFAMLMSLARSPEPLIVLRIFQGAFCGTLGAAITLVASETPERELGLALGLMQTIQFGGQALGPLAGGLLADSLGYRAVFPVSSVTIGIALLLVTSLVRERHGPARETSTAAKPKGRARLTGALDRNTTVLLVAMGSASLAISIVSPILSLYVQSLNTAVGRVATVAGAAVSVSAFTAAVAALVIGRVGDKIGQKTVLVVCIVGVAMVHLPQALVANASQLLVLRAVQGAFLGGMMPTANALLAHSTSPEKRGVAFGLSSSAGSAGRAVGPMIGAGIANSWNMGAVFYVASALYAVIAALVVAVVRAPAATAIAATTHRQLAQEPDAVSCGRQQRGS